MSALRKRTFGIAALLSELDERAPYLILSVGLAVLSRATNELLVFPFRQSANFIPIFFPDIIIDFYRARIETIDAPLLATGNPILFLGLAVKLVGLKSASRKGKESAAFLI